MTQWHSFSVPTRGATLAAQVAGSPADPAVVLHYGATGSRDWWPDEFCSLFVDAGFRVVRYDPRDTGESTHSPPGAPDYTGDDLADDLIAVMDAAGDETAVLTGLSMGGGLIQSVAARHPSRVSALVLMSTTPAFATDAELPPPTPVLRAVFDAPLADPDWRDRDAVIAWALDGERPYAGPDMFDEAEVRAAVGATWNRDLDMSSASNHFVAIEAGTRTAFSAADLGGLPGLVVHGWDDPLLPLPHGEALAAALGVPLMVLDGAGHQVPPRRFWPEIIERVTSLR